MSQSEFDYSGNTIRLGEHSWQVEYRIKDVFRVGERIIALYDPDSYKEKFGQFPNLVAFDLNGRDLWTAELPTNESGDCYVEIVSKNPLVVNSWKSFSCEIDLETGKIKGKEFYK